MVEIIGNGIAKCNGCLNSTDSVSQVCDDCVGYYLLYTAKFVSITNVKHYQGILRRFLNQKGADYHNMYHEFVDDRKMYAISIFVDHDLNNNFNNLGIFKEAILLMEMVSDEELVTFEQFIASRE